jgi:hypothetical protein
MIATAGRVERARAAAERETAQRGVTTIGLNVFGANVVVRRLYESAGYDVTSLQMRKPLRSDHELPSAR